MSEQYQAVLDELLKDLQQLSDDLETGKVPEDLLAYLESKPILDLADEVGNVLAFLLWSKFVKTHREVL